MESKKEALDGETEDLLPCPFCGSEPERFINNEILHVKCPNCISIGFHNHVRLGCRADTEWNTRQQSNKTTQQQE